MSTQTEKMVMKIKTTATVLGVDVPVHLFYSYQPRQDGGSFIEPIKESLELYNIIFPSLNQKITRELNEAGLEYLRSERAGDEVERVL